MPKVSVIIPTFNCEGLISEAIQSVLDQSFKDFEIIVVDDGSTDNTNHVLKLWIDSAIIRYVYQANGGLPNARNAGIRIAKGEFIKFLDADDFLYPMQLEYQVHHLCNKPATVISITDYEMQFPSQKKTQKEIKLGDSYQLGRIMSSNFGPIHACLVRRVLVEKLGGFNESLTSYEDVDFWIRALMEGGHFERLEYVGCCYRILGGSVSSNSENQFKNLCKVIEDSNIKISDKIDQIPNDTMKDILESNTRLMHMCYVRKLNLNLFLPNLLRVSNFICKNKMKIKIRIFSYVFGYEGVAFLKYILYCLKYPNYNNILLNNTSWRNEPKEGI